MTENQLEIAQSCPPSSSCQTEYLVQFSLFPKLKKKNYAL